MKDSKASILLNKRFIYICRIRNNESEECKLIASDPNLSFFRHWWQSWSYDFFFIRHVTELATKDFARGRQEEQDLFLSGKLLLIESLVNSDAKAEERVRSRILACSGLSGILSPLWRFFQHPLTLLDGSISGLLWGRNMFLRLWWLSCVFVVLYIQFYFWTKEAIRSRSMSYT